MFMGNPGNRGGWGGWQNMTSEQKEVRRKEMLDHTTAEGRAMVQVFRREVAARREQRNMPPAQGGFGGFGGFR
jgi:hypothetical protein